MLDRDGSFYGNLNNSKRHSITMLLSVSVYTSQDVLYIVLNLRSQHRGVQSIPHTHSHSWHVKNYCVISKHAYCYSCAYQEKQLFTDCNQEILPWSQSTS